MPNDLVVGVTLEDGSKELVYLDTNYNSTFALMHEDYQLDALPVDLDSGQIQLFVLSPVDLAVSKIARLAESDREDIEALVRAGLTSADEIKARAQSALGGYVGGLEMIRANLRDAVDIARQAERETVQPTRNARRGFDPTR